MNTGVLILTIFRSYLGFVFDPYIQWTLQVTITNKRSFDKGINTRCTSCTYLSAQYQHTVSDRRLTGGQTGTLKKTKQKLLQYRGESTLSKNAE
jgi:hypothetical protein